MPDSRSCSADRRPGRAAAMSLGTGDAASDTVSAGVRASSLPPAGRVCRPGSGREEGGPRPAAAGDSCHYCWRIRADLSPLRGADGRRRRSPPSLSPSQVGGRKAQALGTASPALVGEGSPERRRPSGGSAPRVRTRAPQLFLPAGSRHSDCRGRCVCEVAAFRQLGARGDQPSLVRGWNALRGSEGGGREGGGREGCVGERGAGGLLGAVLQEAVWGRPGAQGQPGRGPTGPRGLKADCRGGRGRRGAGRRGGVTARGRAGSLRRVRAEGAHPEEAWGPLKAPLGRRGTGPAPRLHWPPLCAVIAKELLML